MPKKDAERLNNPSDVELDEDDSIEHSGVNVGDRVIDHSTGRTGIVQRVGKNTVTVKIDPYTSHHLGTHGMSSMRLGGKMDMMKDEFYDRFEQVADGLDEVDTDPANNPGRPDDPYEYIGMHTKPGSALSHPAVSGGVPTTGTTGTTGTGDAGDVPDEAETD